MKIEIDFKESFFTLKYASIAFAKQYFNCIKKSDGIVFVPLFLVSMAFSLLGALFLAMSIDLNSWFCIIFSIILFSVALVFLIGALLKIITNLQECIPDFFEYLKRRAKEEHENRN